MKNLLIMRHAKSSWKDSNLADHERPLKKRGLKDAAEVGKILKRKGWYRIKFFPPMQCGLRILPRW